MSKDFGLLPWHFGGDEVLTYAEMDAYVEAETQLSKAREKQANQRTPTRGRTRRR